MNELHARMKEYLALRSKIDVAKDIQKRIIDRAKQEEAYVEAEKILNETVPVFEKLDFSLRQRARNHWSWTKEKVLCEGLTVRLKTAVKYDMRAAVEWCKATMPELLRVDDKAFEKVMKAMGDLAPKFVSVEEYPEAMIASDLSMYLEEEDVQSLGE